MFIVASISKRRTDNSVLDYPAYELYTDALRQGIYPSEKGKQLRLVVGKDRSVREVQCI